jgi:hypothetical protein
VEKKRPWALEGGKKMEWQFIVILAVAIPVILFPVAFVWYMNLTGIYEVLKEARTRRLSGRGISKQLSS